MDKKPNWAWLPAAMPGVAKLMAQKRKEWGDAHVNQCWKHGVLMCEPGWFYAREGALAVGVPFPADDEWQAVRQMQQQFAGSALLLLRSPEPASGAH